MEESLNLQLPVPVPEDDDVEGVPLWVCRRAVMASSCRWGTGA
jgi:hypothetical protein